MSCSLCLPTPKRIEPSYYNAHWIREKGQVTCVFIDFLFVLQPQQKKIEPRLSGVRVINGTLVLSFENMIDTSKREREKEKIKTKPNSSNGKINVYRCNENKLQS